jgi:hypothetical protein
MTPHYRPCKGEAAQIIHIRENESLIVLFF